MRALILLLTLLFSINVKGQIISVPIPEYEGFQKVNFSQSYTPQQINYYSPFPSNTSLYNNQLNMSIEEKNRLVMKMMQPNVKLPPTQAEIKADSERKKTAYQNQQKSFQKQQRQMLYDVINEDKKYSAPKKTYAQYGKYKFANSASSQYQKHSEYYQKAYDEINKMMIGEKPLSVKDAIYYSENAFLVGELSYEKYSDLIKHYKNLVQLVAKKYKLDLNNNIALQFAIQKLYNDTLYDPQSKTYIPPLTYDFEDIQGDKNYTQLFVSKLMATGKGQCHSMPLLHKILSDEFNGEAYLAYAPNHSYIRFKDESGRFINFETTNGSLTTNNFVVGSGYIKSEAILNKIYTKEVDTRQLIAQLLSELATSFRYQLGYDDFIEECVSTTRKYYPNCITAHMEKSNLETAKLDKALFDINYPSYEQLKEYPKELEQLKFVLAIYNNIDKLGYSTMPKEAYEKWLKSLEEERQKQENQKLRIQLNFNKFE